MAGIRLGMAFAQAELINYINRIKAPYNLNSLTIEAAFKRLPDELVEAYSIGLEKQIQVNINKK